MSSACTALTDIVMPTLGDGDWNILDSVPANDLNALAHRYRSADPFPHLIIDGLFDPQMLRDIGQGFAAVAPRFWSESRHRLQSKRSTLPGAPLPTVTQGYFERLNSAPMYRFLTAVTGVQALRGDATLLNGGMHEVASGGHFDLHIDFPYHPTTRCRSRMVMITYLNTGWLAEYGGGLELWAWKPRQLRTSILPLFGRTLIMEVGPHNVHGHPRSVATPGGVPRRSLASYFYTEPDIRPDEILPDTTAYVDRPDASMDQRLVRMLVSALPSPALGAARKILGRSRPPANDLERL